ncbi:unnamed protein product [Amoebophrya sp. A120]|nr:unnamed protein product [Amoebophrya sp. A120]|eukprot:GSA120T00003355001.1
MSSVTLTCPNEKKDLGGIVINEGKVVLVNPNSWAASLPASQLDIGDVLVDVNGTPLTTVTDLAKRKQLLSGANLKLKLDRPQQRCQTIVGQLQDKTPGCRMKGRQVSWIGASGFAVEIGVQVNDELIAIDGKGYSELTPDEKMNALTKIRPLQMLYQRPGASEPTVPRAKSVGLAGQKPAAGGAGAADGAAAGSSSGSAVASPGGGGLFAACCSSCAAKRGAPDEIIIV